MFFRTASEAGIPFSGPRSLGEILRGFGHHLLGPVVVEKLAAQLVFPVETVSHKVGAKSKDAKVPAIQLVLAFSGRK